MDPKARLQEQLRKWQKELINLSGSNRLLYFRPTKRSTLDIVEPEPADLLKAITRAGEKGLAFYEPSDPGGQAVWGEPQPSVRTPSAVTTIELLTSVQDPKSLQSSLRNIERRSKQEFMDKGLRILYLGLGLLRWVDAEGDHPEQVESPLLLVPVEVFHDREGVRGRFRLRRVDEDPSVNPALSVKLEHAFGLSLPGVDELEEGSLSKLFSAVTRCIKGQRGWALSNQTVLGLFSFHKEVMYRDLIDNEEMIAGHPLVRSLTLGGPAEAEPSYSIPDEAEIDRLSPPEAVATIRDADASQRRCIVSATAGRSFVIDGPPGTGKSQTIANIIAELLKGGRTVLFVSEKAAALEVVHSRLEAAGIADFILPLHSHRATRREVARALGQALENKPRSLQRFDELKTRRLIVRREELSEYAEALNELRPELQRSLQQILGRVAQLHRVPQAPPATATARGIDATRLVHALETARALARAWAPVEQGEAFVWRGVAETGIGAGERRHIVELLDRALSRLSALEGGAASLDTRIPGFELPSPGKAGRYAELLFILQDRREIPIHWLTGSSLAASESRALTLQREIGEAQEAATQLEGYFGKRWAEISPAAYDRAVSSHQVLRGSDPPWAPPTGWTTIELDRLASFCRDCGPSLRALTQDARRIAEAFALPGAQISLIRASELAELGQLAAARHAPETPWLHPVGLQRCREGATLLQARLEDLAKHRERLSEVFSEKVLDLDLEALCVRFERVHTGLRKLLPAHWKDRAKVKECTKGGRVDSTVLARLRDALAWSRARSALKTAEETNAAFLGRYYRRERTDFEAVNGAITVASRALSIVGNDLNLAKLEAQLCRRGQDADPSVLLAAGRLTQSLASWRSEAAAMFGEEVASSLQRQSDDQIQAWTDLSKEATATLAQDLRAATETAGMPLTLERFETGLRHRARRAQLEALLAGAAAEAGHLLGDRYRGLETDLADLEAALEWTRKLRTFLGGTVDGGVASQILDLRQSAEGLLELLKGWRLSRIDVLGLFVPARHADVSRMLDGRFTSVRESLQALRAEIDSIATWGAFSTASNALSEIGLGEVMSFAVRERVARSEVAETVERSILEAWSDSVLRSDARLKNLRAEDREHLVHEFRELDRDFVSGAACRVIDACNERRPVTSAGAAGIIRREAQKERKHMPIRNLLAETQAVATALKPCFMMSPLTVSQFLPPTLQFDAVIFDEASQVRPSDAINCIYRGNQLIVAGDQRQLPPTSFFDNLSNDGGDEWEEDQIEDFESVLDLCKASASFPTLGLRWHYRSQHEDLITFSNYSFYSGRLLTFPGAQESGADLGVELFHVPTGVYRRGGPRDNPIEARVVADRVMFHLARNPHASIGVVAFSEAQAEAVEQEVERRVQMTPNVRLPEGRLHGFFVKNLESVQGDERDIMIFSVGYGRDENGKFTLQLGPITKKGGERRLNVAVTRARRRVEVVSSVLAADFVAELASEGVRHLKRYLDYAERKEAKVHALALDTPGLGDAESPFEEEVARLIRSWGYDVVPQLGCADYRIDMAVRHPERPGSFALGVECDGARYHSSRAARDRDRLRQEILSGLGWRLHRIWGPAWYRGRAEQEARLRTAIEEAISSSPKSLAAPPPATVGAATVYDALDLDGPPKWTIRYKVSRPVPPRGDYEMHVPEAGRDLRRMIQEVASVEGPVVNELVLLRVREAWGVQRAKSRIRAAFEEALKDLRVTGKISVDRQGVIRVPGRQLERVRTPGEDLETVRDIETVPREELDLALERLVLDAKAIGWEELTTRVARLFGWKRRGPDIAKALDSAVTRLLKAGRILGEKDATLRSAQ